MHGTNRIFISTFECSFNLDRVWRRNCPRREGRTANFEWLAGHNCLIFFIFLLYREKAFTLYCKVSPGPAHF